MGESDYIQHVIQIYFNLSSFLVYIALKLEITIK